MIVWIVEMGEPSEGGYICGVFLSEEPALKLQKELESKTTWEWVSCEQYEVQE